MRKKAQKRACAREKKKKREKRASPGKHKREQVVKREKRASNREGERDRDSPHLTSTKNHSENETVASHPEQRSYYETMSSGGWG